MSRTIREPNPEPIIIPKSEKLNKCRLRRPCAGRHGGYFFSSFQAFRNPLSVKSYISDVYFAEVCVVSHVCKNREKLFQLDYGDPFVCEFDHAAFMQLRSWLE